ncbi:MAG: 2-hydroxyacyl-CoA dehydratase, partial [Bacillota bacterium]
MSSKLATIPERVTKSTEGAKQVNKIVKQMYAKAEEAKANGAPIAWSMVGIPKVIFVPLGIQPLFPEQVSSAFAAKQQALSFVEKSDTTGYPGELCGYARCNLGYAIRQDEVGGVPPEAPYAIDKPQALLACTAICDTRSKWFQAVSQHMDTPLFVLDQQYPSFDVDP